MSKQRMLELLKQGEVDKVIKALKEEIYQSSLSSNKGEKQRYSAMKRYFRFTGNDGRPSFLKPCKVNFQGEEYYSFLDGYSCVLTTEDIGEIEEFNTEEDGEYFDVSRVMDVSGEQEIINISKVLANGKAEGYRYLKSETQIESYQYLFNYKESFYRLALLDKAYSILDNGEDVAVTYKSKNSPLLIENSIGKCIILPMNLDRESVKQLGKTVITL